MNDLFRSHALRQFMAKILENKDYDDLVNRCSHFLVTENDVNLFSKMIGDIYEKGYMKAVADYKDQLAKLGIKINITQKNLVDSP